MPAVLSAVDTELIPVDVEVDSVLRFVDSEVVVLLVVLRPVESLLTELLVVLRPVDRLLTEVLTEFMPVDRLLIALFVVLRPVDRLLTVVLVESRPVEIELMPVEAEMDNDERLVDKVSTRLRQGRWTGCLPRCRSCSDQSKANS